MAVELPAEVQERGERLGRGVRYALKVLCGQLEDNPLLGSPTGEPSMYAARIDGETFEDCPELDVQYAYGPPMLAEGQVRILSVEAAQPAAVAPEREPVAAPDPRLEEMAARQVTAAWQRVETWLRDHAPVSFDSLQEGASSEEIDRAERELGVRVPGDLRALWHLHRGVQSSSGAAFLPDNAKLMTIAEAIELHQHWGQIYDFGDGLWDHRWIPVCTLGEHSWSNGLYLDAGTGEVWSWDEFANRRVEFESLTTLLEEMADALEAPSLAGPAKPGLVDGALVWGTP
ncbi:SMI1/KNR4 family protein [Streptomyces maoxianensis]|uniref:SMI1/KNR4 family protein n=1 Tax=Streptomyces maoxianensis TaxID=1459942 RepID=A0ABV9GJT7_9ACTN